ncbi:sortase B protein-sorting domain-containing protein [Cohnella yongneupensis]|uniref:Sortase B protein-sorting domain-containing protein n=1 Tax=Cohnella yongneupensis TaxID=425006 RepID=A0ABW0QZP2_9BACL
MKTVVKPRKLLASFVLVFMLALAMGLSAMAADGDLVYDNYNRTDLKAFDEGSKAAWADGNGAIDGNALKIAYGSEGWFGTGGGIDASTYKYLVFRIKGAAGGEGDAFNLNYAAPSGVKNTNKSFSDLVGPSGDKIPAITTEYQDIVIDLAASGIDSDIQGFHFNFHKDVSGSLWIDTITFTNTAPNAPAAEEPAKDDDGGAAATDDQPAAEPAAEPNPQTGDTSNTSLYVMLAAVSGAAVVMLSIKARKANR